MSPEPVLSSVKRDRFTMTVDDAIAEFSRNGFLVAPHTIQRWCQASKIDAIKVDANTLLPTNREPWKLLIDASSVASRIATERDNPNTALKTISLTSRDAAAPERASDAFRRGGDATLARKENSTDWEREGESERVERIKELEKENMMLKIDNSARDQVIAQVKEDRKELIDQLQGFVDKIADQSLKIGQLREKLLQLGAPSDEGGENSATDPKPNNV